MRGIVLLLAISTAFQVTPARAGETADAIAEYMRGCVQADSFNGAVLVAQDDEVVFSRGFGMANFEHDVPNTPETKFRIGSITKQFTAMAILILQEQGKLNVQDPVSKYLRDAPGAWSEVTIHHLLTHTSGIRSFTGMAGYGRDMRLRQTVKQMLDRFRDEALEFEPGEKFRYSNSGYFLLGVVIERVSGKSYENFLHDEIFEPLEMNDTGYDRFQPILKHRATGYRRTGREIVHDEFLDMSQPFAAGALYSTVVDLNRWDQALRRRDLISDTAYDAMYRVEKGNYAYGWLVQNAGKRTIISHGGGINGFLSHIRRLPEQRICVVVLCNVPPAEPQSIAKDLSSILLGDPYEVPRARVETNVADEVLDSFVGNYELGPGLVVTVRRAENGVSVKFPGQKPIDFVPNSELTLFNRTSRGEIRFVRNKDGQVTAMRLEQSGLKVQANRVQE